MPARAGAGLDGLLSSLLTSTVLSLGTAQAVAVRRVNPSSFKQPDLDVGNVSAQPTSDNHPSPCELVPQVLHISGARCSQDFFVFRSEQCLTLLHRKLSHFELIAQLLSPFSSLLNHWFIIMKAGFKCPILAIVNMHRILLN